MNKYFDHTYLKPDATYNNIKKLYDEAVENDFFSICIAPSWLNFFSLEYKDSLKKNDSAVRICTVIDFPHGNIGTDLKCRNIYDIKIDNITDEFDVVINFGNIKSGYWNIVNDEIKRVRNSTQRVIKYIIEIGYLNDDEIKKICEILINNKIDFVKTCTGYGPRNVTIDDIKKLKNICGNNIKIKASGGIKTLEFAQKLIECGADRIGSSSSVEIMKEYKLLNSGEINERN